MQDEAVMIMRSFNDEVDQAIKNLLQIIGIEPDVNKIEEHKRKMANDDMEIRQLASALNFDRVIIMLRHKKEVIAGYLVHLDLDLNIIKRILLETDEELQKAIFFLISPDKNEKFNLDRDDVR